MNSITLTEYMKLNKPPKGYPYRQDFLNDNSDVIDNELKKNNLLFEDITKNMGALRDESVYRKKLINSSQDNEWLVVLLHPIGTFMESSTVHHSVCNGSFVIIRSGQETSYGTAQRAIVEVYTSTGFTMSWNRGKIRTSERYFPARLVVCTYEGKVYIALNIYNFISKPSSIYFNGEILTIDKNALKLVSLLEQYYINSP